MLNLIGQTLDGKYAIERELGRGGMGTVYFATHIGTERPVAVKVISPQFMAKNEFVERFRREARAAGRLRHPNVVDVTDFGIAETRQGKTAYLVMEYLDGCTLGEVLEEEKQIPLSWSLDILEQVCSAVNEAHEQGIIHRDLKPDNIWLEPNQRGGYTVKVLDFGIAKLEEHVAHTAPDGEALPAAGNGPYRPQLTVPDQKDAGTMIGPRDLTAAENAQTSAQGPVDQDAGTLIQSGDIDLESGTAILPASQTLTAVPADDDGTKIISEPHSIAPPAETSSSAELTRVGAVLGTPLYMSPEQCRGEKLDARSDIYSLGIITYQMLGGETPFTGNYSDVMQAHRECTVPPLQVKNVSRKVKKIVMSALEKDANMRPQTAEAYASKLRAHSAGMGELLRRGIAIYAEHLPKFLFFNLLFAIPFILLTLMKVTLQFLGLFNVVPEFWADMSVGVIEFVKVFVQMFFGAIVMGATTWIVAQILAMPLRPIDLKATFREVKKRWKPLVYVSTVNGILVFIGVALCFIPGILLSARNMLIGPAVMMEGLKGRAAFRRSKELVSRSFGTVMGTVVVMHLVPIFFAMIMSLSVMSFAYNIADIYEKQQKKSEQNQAQNQADTPAKGTGDTGGDNKDIGMSVGPAGITITDDNAQEIAKKNKEEKSPAKRTAAVISQGIFDVIWMPIVIFITSFISVITALIYFKTRQAGGESMRDLLAQFEEADNPQSKWQERVRARLQQSGRTSSKHGSKSNSKP